MNRKTDYETTSLTELQSNNAPEFHDQVTEAYYGRVLSPAFMEKTRERVHWICSQVHGPLVLDMGCSQGLVPILLGREGMQVIGLDINSKVLQQAASYLEEEDEQVQQNVCFVNADASTYKPTGGCLFDTILITEVLEHMLYPDRLISSAATLLHQGGKVVVTVPFGINDYLDHKQTYYLHQPFMMLSKYFAVKNVIVLGQWSGFVAVHRDSGIVELDFQEVIKVLENGFSNLETLLRDKLSSVSLQLEGARQKNTKLRSEVEKGARIYNEKILELEKKIFEKDMAIQKLKYESKLVENQFVEAGRELEEMRSRFEQVATELKVYEDRMTQIQDEKKATQENLQFTLDEYADSHSKLLLRSTRLNAELSKTRQSLMQAEYLADIDKTSATYLLGDAIAHGFASWANFLSMPAKVWRIWKDAKEKRKCYGLQSSRHRDKLLEEIRIILKRDGSIAAERYIFEHSKSMSDQAVALGELAKNLLSVDFLRALRLAEKSFQLEPRPFRQKWLAFCKFDAGQLEEAHDLLLSLPQELRFSTSEKNKAKQIQEFHALAWSPLPILETKSTNTAKGDTQRILYAAASGLPYHITGYTLRTHAILKAIERRGWQPFCVTRLGYPNDRADAMQQGLDELSSYEYGGIRYDLLPGSHRYKVPFARYFQEAADLLVRKIEEECPALIQAASNFESAIPALMAARRTGRPFIYEVRGLWEYTRSAKIRGWEKSEMFALHKKMESFLVRNADHVLTTSTSLATELTERGATRVSLLPNAIDPTIEPMPYDENLAASLGLTQEHFVIGYIGSLTMYEGLNDLLRAFELVVRKLGHARLLIVGAGQLLEELKCLAVELGISEKTIFAGQVQPEETPRYYSLLKAAALPRLPYSVCSLVPPLKTYEIMSMDVPLVISDLPALIEQVRPKQTALLCKPGEHRSLAAELLRLAENKSLARSLADRARQDVLQKHTWAQRADDLEKIYTLVINEGACRATRAQPAKSLPAGANTSSVPSDSDANNLERELLLCFKSGGCDTLLSYLESNIKGQDIQVAAEHQLTAASFLMRHGKIEAAIELINASLASCSTTRSLRMAMRLFYDAALVEKAVEIANQLKFLLKSPSDADQLFFNKINQRLELFKASQNTLSRSTHNRIKKRLVYPLAFSLPYTSSGYATRSHGLAVGIQKAGWDIRPYTRPGYPYDTSKADYVNLPDYDEIDGLSYRRMFDIKRNRMTEEEYLSQSVLLWETCLKSEQANFVQAASNYVTAQSALIAARRCGLPFIYEVRGSWETTRASRDDSFMHTPKYHFMAQGEGLVINQAEHVFAITQALKEELMGKYGVGEHKISVIPNCVDPDRFQPRQRDKDLARKLAIPESVPVIGYIGSFVDYEGLDDLLDAVAILRDTGLDFRLLLVGDGAVRDILARKALNLDLTNKLIMPGRVPFAQVGEYYSLIDIAPFPRKAWPVSELVTPLKPLEAMAMEKAVVCSNTKALMEQVSSEKTGLLFEKGEVASLYESLARLISEPDLRRHLGKNARQWTIRERSWEAAGRMCAEIYRRIER